MISFRSFASVTTTFALIVVGCSGSPGSGDDASTDDASAGDGSADSTATDSSPTDGAVKDAAPDNIVVVDSGDGFGALRTACINEINKLRATEGHAAYTLWTGSAIDTCVDEQATNDQTANSPHQAWLQGKYPTCNGNAQDECIGWGNTVQGIVGCLDSMWAEKNQSNCSGCAACQAQFTQNCPNCDFYGQNGPECGHYVNMSADYLSYAACGFSTLPSKQWACQNFK